jgi:hypothetical protein
VRRIVGGDRMEERKLLEEMAGKGRGCWIVQG